jgi:uncharacterized OB-fold protein/acyl dehydratase
MFSFDVMSGALVERLREFVGRPTAPPVRARDPVNQPMIRHWCDAMGDHNPVYTDPASAAGSRHGGVIAPPAMLQAWTMRGLSWHGMPEGEYRIGQIFALLDDAGFTSVVATNSEQEYARPLRLGEHLTVSGVFESVSDEKRTALGPGHFVSWVDTYRTDEGEVVGTMRFRVLKFRPPPANQREPAAADPALPPPRRPRPAISDDTRFFWEGVDRGELRIQRCLACGRLRHPPGPMCPACRSLDWDAIVASGRGVVHSYVVPHHPRLPAFPERYVVALVDLEEGTRLVTNLVGVEPEAVRIGMAVELAVTRVDDELTLPLFRPAAP